MILEWVAKNKGKGSFKLCTSVKFLFLKAYLSGTSVRPDHVAVFVFFLTVLNDSNCTINHEIPLKN